MNMSLRKTPKRRSTLNQEQIAYINGCAILQKAVWRMTHQDPLSALCSQFELKTIRRAVYILIAIREKSRETGLRCAFEKWQNIAKTLRAKKDRLRVLLKMLVINYDSDQKGIISKYFHKWQLNTAVSESEILEKYGHLFEFLDMLKYYSLFPAKEHFFKNLKNSTSSEYLKKPLKNCLKVYGNKLQNSLKKAFNKWRLNAKNGELQNLKIKLLKVSVTSTVNNKEKQKLLKALRKWHNFALTDKLIDEFDEEDFNTRVKFIFSIYRKWNKINRLNNLSRAFAKWRLNTAVKKEPLKDRILKAKKHMLKHNINQNAEDLLNALREKAEVKRLENLLRRAILRAPKYNLPLLRKTFRKWYYNSNALKNNELLRNLKLKYVTNTADKRIQNQLKDLLRKAFQTFRRNATVPKTILPDTEKAISLLRKATTQPFFQKMRENLLNDMNKERFRALIACYFRQNDKDILHWWFGQWRKNAMRLKVYELKALLLKHLADSKERNEKLKALRNLKDKISDYRNKEVLKTTVIKNVITKIEKVENEYDKGQLAKAFYVWKSKVEKKESKKVLDIYEQGTNLLQRFCRRFTHEDVISAFDYKITIPAIIEKLRKMIITKNKNDLRNKLLRHLYQWRMNCSIPKEDMRQKMKALFEKYYVHEPIQQELYSGYKDIIRVMKKSRQNKEDAAKKIADYLRGINDIPTQLRKLKRTKYLLEIIEMYTDKQYFKYKSAFNEWSRRARVIKADEDSRIIQKYIRDRLAKRLKKKRRYEESIEYIAQYIKYQVFNKIVEKANKNQVPDILIKYLYRKNALDMKNLRDKFNHWRNMLPFMRLNDAAARIQAIYRGYDLRKDFNRFTRLNQVLYNILGRILEKNNKEPAFYKWRKNARLLECQENSKIIQRFCRQKLKENLKQKTKQDLQNLFKDYIFKLIADMMSTKIIEPDDIDKLSLAIKKYVCRQPFDKLLKGLRWKLILQKLKHIPNIYEKYRKQQLDKYLDIWYNNAIIIPNDMASKIQNKFRNYLSNKKIADKKRLMIILEQIVIRYLNYDDEKILHVLKKWNKNARRIKCEEDSKIIQIFCRRINNKNKNEIIKKWKYLAGRIMPHAINQTAKFNHVNKLLNKLLKGKFWDNLVDFANRKNLLDMLRYLIEKKEKNNLKNLLRKKLRDWLDRAKKLRDVEYDAASYIQSMFRGHQFRKQNRKFERITYILTKIIIKIVNTSDDLIPAILRKWQKNARLSKCEEDAKIIQRYCRNILGKIKKKKKEDYLKRIGEGLDVLSNLRLNIGYAFDKIFDRNKKNALIDLVGYLQDKINNRNRDTFDDIYQYGIDKLLRNLVFLRNKCENDLLKNAFNKWRNNANKLGKLRAVEMIQRNWLNHFYDKLRNRLNYILTIIVNRRNETEKDKLRRILKKWNENANKIGKELAAKRISKFITEYYILTNVKKNWKNLSDKLRNKNNKDSLNELRDKLKEYKVLKDLMDQINNKVKKDGIDNLKQGNNWIKILEVLKILFEEQDGRNNNKILKRYLNKWSDKVKKLKERENKLEDALDEMDKRQLIDSINTFANASLMKKLKDSIPVARAYNFFDKLRNLDRYRKNILDLKNNLLKKLLRKISKNQLEIIRNKIKEWNDKAKKIRDNASKNRIAQWVEERYGISNARKNWKKLTDLYDLYMNKKPIYEIRKKIIQYKTLENLTNNLKNKIVKDGINRLKDSVDRYTSITCIKKIIEKYEISYQIENLKHYLNKWNNIANKLKRRDEKLLDAMNEIEKRQIINDVNTLADAELTKQVLHSIPVARAYDFFDKLRDLYNRKNKSYEIRKDVLTKIMISIEKYNDDYLRNKLRQWNDKAKKIRDNAAKNRIAQWIEERYKISNARKNWEKLSDLYYLYMSKRPIYELRQRLIKYKTLEDLTNKLRDKLRKDGNKQLKEGVNYLIMIKYLKQLFENVDGINDLEIQKHYLKKWNDKAKKLKNRDNKLKKGLDEIEKRQLINDVNTIADAEIIKRFNDSIPIARAREFFKSLKDLERRKRDLMNFKKNVMRRIVITTHKKYIDILRKKFMDWYIKAMKMRDDTTKNRIARYFEIRYKTINARKNWEKLSNLYDLYMNKRPISELRQKLIRYKILNDLTNQLRNKLTKEGNKQFKDGVEYIKLLNILKQLFQDVDDSNIRRKMQHYLNNWNDEAKKLKNRDNKLRKGLDEIEKRQLINDVNTIADVELTKQLIYSIPVARAYDFLDKLRDLSKRRNLLSKIKVDILRKIIRKLVRYSDDNLRNKLRQWLTNANKIRDNAAKNRIAQYIEERFRISNARKNWRKLSDLYDFYMNKKPLYELRQRLIKYKTLEDLTNKLRDKLRKDGNKQLKDGMNYLNILKILKQLFQNIDGVNKLLTLKFYLNKWNDKAKKLKKRDNKLRKGLDEIEKRQLINDVNTIADAELTNQLLHSIPVARAIEFFKSLRDLDRKRRDMSNYKINILRRIIISSTKYYNDIMRNKLRQWLTNANKIRDNAAKNRIAQWIEERFRISNARKNWEKLSNLYDLYMNKKPLYELRQRLIKYKTLKDISDKLKNNFIKTGIDQLKEGINYIKIIKHLRKLFEDIDDINRLLTLKYYLNKWNNKAKKLKDRENKLKKGINEIEKRQLINDVDTIADAELTKQVLHSIPVARAYDFFDKLRDLYNRKNKSFEIRNDTLTKIIITIEKYNDEYLRNKLRQWNDKAKKIRDNAAKNRIAQWIEERFRISNARKNWKKLSDLYYLYMSKRPIYELRQRLIKYKTLEDLTNKLRDKLRKDGNKQLKDGINYLKILKYLKQVFQNIDEVNQLLTLKYYLNKWDDKAKKLKNRDNKLKKGLDEIEKRQLINDVNTIADAELTKQVLNSIPVARAYNFFDKLRDLDRKRRDLSNYKINILRRIVINLTKYDENILKNRLRQWLKNANKIRDNAAKNRIAQWIEERYRISNARKNWRKLSDLYYLYMSKKPIYELRQRLIKYMILKDLADKLRNKFTKTGKDQFKEGIDNIIKLKYLRKLFEDVDDINKLLTMKYYLNKWNNKAKKLKNRDNKLKKGINEVEKRQLINDTNTIADVELTKQLLNSIPVARAYDFFDKLRELYNRKNKSYEIRKDVLTKITISIEKYNVDYLRNKLRQWNDKAKKIRDNAAKNRIAQWIEERFRISNARKNWKKLSDLYYLYMSKRPIYELRQRLIKYKTLEDLTNKLRDKLRKNGNKQLKDCINYLTILKILKQLFQDMDEVNKLLTLKYYLNKWNDKAKKLKNRDNKLKKGLDEIEKRQLINDVNTIADTELTKQVLNSIPVARAYDFFDKLKDLDRKRRDLSNYKINVLRRIIVSITKYYDDLLRNKLMQWHDRAHKIRDNAAKNRIAKWTEERFRISNTRKNWKKLYDLYYLYMKNRPLHDLRQRLIKFKTIKDLADKLRNKLTKDGKDQFKDGIEYIVKLKYLRKLFEDIDDINKLLTLKYYLNKWNNKATKLKNRDNKLKKGINEIEKRQLINDTNTIADAELTKQILNSIPVTRAYDFFDKLRDLYNRKNRSYEIRKDVLTKIMISIEKYNDDYLRNKLRQWLTNANKIRDNAAKNRIAQWIEERYRISNARKNWKKLSDLYDFYKKKTPLYNLRKKLIEYLTLKDLSDNLRNNFIKTGIDQLKEGVDYIKMIKYLRKLFEDVDDINKLITLKFYLNKWNNKAKKLKNRDNKLKKGLDEIEKRQLINDVNTIADAELTKQLIHSIPVARAYDFLNKLRELERRKRDLSNYKINILRRIVNLLIRNDDDILRNKLRQWNDKAKKIRDNAAKNRIAQWVEERYRISNARKNWRKLTDLYDLYMNKKPIFELRDRLVKYKTLNNFSDRLRNKLAKEGNDRFKNGIKYINILKILKKLFINIDEINELLTLKYYLNKWNDKAKKLKNRDNKLKKGLKEIEKRQLINDTNTIADAELTKQLIHSIPVARAYDFLDKLRELKKKQNELYEVRTETLKNVTIIIETYYEKILRSKIKKWSANANKIRDNAAKNRIAQWIEERYRISNARKNWKKLSNLYDLYMSKKPIYELRQRLIKYKTLKDLSDKLRNRFIKSGIDQLKEGADYITIIKYLRKIFEDFDDVNNSLTLKYYLNKWNDKTKKLKNRDNKLKKGLDEIEKRQLINDVNTIADAEITKQLIHSIPVARAYDFLNKLRELEKRRRDLSNYKINILRRIVNILIRNDDDILRNKLRQWNDKAKKIRDNAAKNRIAQWIEERYRISNARKNWRKLIDLYNLYMKNRPLHDLRNRLIRYKTLDDLSNNLKNRLTKSGIDQLKNGMNYIIILKTCRKLFENIDDINKLLTLKYYLNKWNDKKNKLKNRENKLKKGLDEIEKRQLINDVNIISDAEMTNRLLHSIPVARAYDFLDKFKDFVNKRNKLSTTRITILTKIITKLSRYTDENLRNKLRQWLSNANKIRDESAKNRIAQWIEERYRISNARKNWRKLTDIYYLYMKNRPLSELRKKLIKYITLKNVADKLKNKFTKTGNDQLKEGIRYITLLKRLRKLLEDVDDNNNYAILLHHLRKWNDKAKKLKSREDLLTDAFNILNIKNIKDAANTIKNASIVKKVNSAIHVARVYDFLDRLRNIYNKRRMFEKLGDDLIQAKDDLDGFNKTQILNRIYKIYYFKVIDNMYNTLDKLKNRYKNFFGDYLLKLLQNIYYSKRKDHYINIKQKEKEPDIKQLSFKGKTDRKLKIPQNRSPLTMILPSLTKYLESKFLNQKGWAMDNLLSNDRALKFAKLYKSFSDKSLIQPKRDLVDLLKAEYAYMNGLGAANCDLFKLLRRYWVRLVCGSMLAPSRIYKILYLIKMVMMHKTIAYQRFIRELVRKWRFSAFVQSISRKKLELMYKNLHVSYLQMANELFGEKGGNKGGSVVKEFERLANKMGMFTNEDYSNVTEENFCEKIKKTYVFQPMPLLLEKEGPTQFFASGIEIEDSGENNEDYYVDQELGGETIGKYKQETNKSGSRNERNSSRLSKFD